MTAFQSPKESGPFVQETLAPLAQDRHACSFGPIPLAKLTEAIGSAAIVVSSPSPSTLPELQEAQFYGYFDRGSVQTPEDKAIITLPFIGAFDGTSGVFYPGGPPKKLYDETLSGGEMAVRCIAEIFQSNSGSESVHELLNQANARVAQIHESHGLNLNEGGSLGGAVGAAVKFSSSHVDVVQFGDAIVVWELHNGTCGMSVNQTLYHEQEMLSTISVLMKELSTEFPGKSTTELRAEMWHKFGPFLTEKRNERINCLENRGYGFLCGQDNFNEAVISFQLPLADLKAIIVGSDGLVPFEETVNPQKLAQDTIKRFRAGGFESVIEHQRKCEALKATQSHVNRAEAVGVAVIFPDKLMS